jgi:hypothetical protein
LLPKNELISEFSQSIVFIHLILFLTNENARLSPRSASARAAVHVGAGRMAWMHQAHQALDFVDMWNTQEGG